MHWAALQLPTPPGSPWPAEAERQGLAHWALQFTPRVACVEDSVLLELQASLRLFGGAAALRARLEREGRAQGAQAIAWAATGLAAQALARAGQAGDAQAPVGPLLAPLPLTVLSATAPHQDTLARLGCRTLGDLRRLPRAGLGRRFGPALLDALDQAHGEQPEAHPWVTVAERFDAQLELGPRVESAPALLAGAERLLQQLCGWLTARQAGVLALTLRWLHDSLRARSQGEGGHLGLRTALPCRDPQHLGRLLAEHLAQVRLEAPVGLLRLQADETAPWPGLSDTLWPDPTRHDEALVPVLERLSARLGPQRVQVPVPQADHRPEHMQRWQPATGPRPPAAAPAAPAGHALPPQPSWLLAEPQRLALRGPLPQHQGPLQLLSGPHRVESGWWDRQGPGPRGGSAQVQRDYWVALSERAGLLWVYQERLQGEDGGWYLHGLFG